MSATAANYLMILLKYAIIGLIVGAVVVALVVIVVSGPSSFFSKNSSWLGTEKQWARMLLLYMTVRGALCGLVLGLIGGLIRIAVLSRRG